MTSEEVKLFDYLIGDKMHPELLKRCTPLLTQCAIHGKLTSGHLSQVRVHSWWLVGRGRVIRAHWAVPTVVPVCLCVQMWLRTVGVHESVSDGVRYSLTEVCKSVSNDVMVRDSLSLSLSLPHTHSFTCMHTRPLRPLLRALHLRLLPVPRPHPRAAWVLHLPRGDLGPPV
jgi:hypothetical protein